MVARFCSLARARLIPTEVSWPPPSLVVSAPHRLSGAGAVRGTGGRLLSAPDALAGELGLVVQAWPVWVYGRPTAGSELCSRHECPAAYRILPWGWSTTWTDAQVKGQVIECRPDVDPRHRMGVH